MTREMLGSIWIILIPLYVLGALLLVFGTFALLGRVAGGKYLKPIVAFLMKVPLVGRGMRKMSQAALERQNPELAAAVKKMERAGVARHPQRAAQALSPQKRAETAAYLDATTEGPSPVAQRERLDSLRLRPTRVDVAKVAKALWMAQHVS